MKPEQSTLRISYPQISLFSTQGEAENCLEMGTKLVATQAEISKRGRPRLYETRAENKRAYRQRKKSRAIFPPLPQGPYRVLYADPPWQYENDGMRKYGHVAFHYPTVPTQTLCQLPVRRILEKKAVLFLWVTSPMLAEAFNVIKAWGFAYKTSLIWNKMGHNFGHYVSVIHEFLLICTRGACKPDIAELYPSVQQIERTEHSAKPPHFRHLIDKLYPHGARLELFARSRVRGWDAWGNESLIDKGVQDGQLPSDS